MAESDDKVRSATNEALEIVANPEIEDVAAYDEDNILLVCKKEDEQNIRQFVNDVKTEKGDKFI